MLTTVCMNLTEVETVTEKYNALLKESAESTSQLRQAEHMQRRNDTERAEQRREIQDLQGEVDMVSDRYRSHRQR